MDCEEVICPVGIQCNSVVIYRVAQRYINNGNNMIVYFIKVIISIF